MSGAPLAYVCNLYPSLSNTFILGEVTRLRELVGDVSVFSIREPSPEHLAARQDREEHARTTYVLPARPGELVAAHVRALSRSPRRYVRTLKRALSLRPAGWRGAIWQLFYFGEAMIVVDHCRRRGVRHLHAHFTDPASDVALLAAHYHAGSRTPVSWSFTVHGPVDFYEVMRRRIPEKVRDAAYVVCISDFARSQLMAFVDEAEWPKLRVVHCGIDTNHYRRRNGHRPGHNANGNRLRLLNVGRFVQLKGQPVLIEAIALLKQRGIAVEATLIGFGSRARQLEQLARRLGVSDSVKFAGAVGQDRLNEYLDETDVFVLPSFAEGLPIVLMEAMAMEVPVVATQIMGIPELVEDDENGLLVPPARPDELADAIARLAESPDLRERLGSAGRRKVEQEFDIEKNVRALARTHAEVIGPAA